MKEITHFDLLSEFMYTLDGNCYLQPLFAPHLKKNAVKEFLIVHIDDKYKLSDYVKVRKLMNVTLIDEGFFTLIQKQDSRNGSNESNLSAITKKAIYIEFY